MATIREQILCALLARLEAVPAATVKREAPLPDLPSLAIEIGHAKLATPKFFRHGGAKLDKLAFTMARTVG